MICREATNLLLLFFDGEHDALTAEISARLDALDLSSLWPAIEKQLPATRPSRWRQWRELWQAPTQRWWVGVPAFAAAAAVAVAAFVMFSRSAPNAAPDAS